jgi:ketosteroid isomerase-like protein
LKRHIETETALIRQSRLDSNTAILRCDVPGIAKYWMDDMVVISGEGGQYIGKKALIDVFTQMFRDHPPVFERIPNEIIIGDSGILAWETGEWNYKTESFRGNYSAMWRKVDVQWLMQSELFVSLD